MITVKKDAIKYKDSEGNMKSAGVLCKVGTFGFDWLQYAYAIWQFFYQANFPQGYELTLNLGNRIGYLEEAFKETSGVKKVKLVGNENGNLIRASNLFWKTRDLEVVDLTEFKFVLSSCAFTFRECPKLKYIYGEMDFSNITAGFNLIINSSYIEEFRVKNGSIKVSATVDASSKFSDETIDSLVNGYADMTGQTSPVLKVHSKVKARIEANEVWLATLTSKNVTLA